MFTRCNLVRIYPTDILNITMYGYALKFSNHLSFGLPLWKCYLTVCCSCDRQHESADHANDNFNDNIADDDTTGRGDNCDRKSRRLDAVYIGRRCFEFRNRRRSDNTTVGGGGGSDWIQWSATGCSHCRRHRRHCSVSISCRWCGADVEKTQNVDS